jgi:hypothetical protein
LIGTTISTILANARTAGETLSGTVFDAATTERLLCDATLHRVIMNGDSAVLDYGTASRTITAPIWAALGAVGGSSTRSRPPTKKAREASGEPVRRLRWGWTDIG